MNKKIMCGSCKTLQSSKRDYFKCTICESFNIINDEKDYTIKEWANFDYVGYLESIFNVIQTDSFSNLKAENVDQIRAGWFTDSEVIKLRKVLRNGFQNELTLKELSEKVLKDVKLRDLYKMNENGSIKLNEDGNPVLQLGRESRSKIIARTEVTRVSNQGAIDFFKDQGVKEVTYIASLGSLTCPICQELDGKIFPITRTPEIPTHVNCRCSYVNITT